MCAVAGVLVLSLPIPIIAGNFEKFHKERHSRDKGAKRKERLKEMKAREEAERLAECGGGPKEDSVGSPGRAMSEILPIKAPMSPHSGSDLVTTKSLY